MSECILLDFYQVAAFMFALLMLLSFLCQYVWPDGFRRPARPDVLPITMLVGGIFVGQVFVYLFVWWGCQ